MFSLPGCENVIPLAYSPDIWSIHEKLGNFLLREENLLKFKGKQLNRQGVHGVISESLTPLCHFRGCSVPPWKVRRE